IAVLIVLAAVGIVSAFAAGQLIPSHNAGAAPTVQQVREQNLDGSGLIRVHEQGTANVNLINGSLPVSGTVNVGNFPSAAQGRLIGLGSQTLTPGANQHAYYQSAFVNVSDFRAITAMAVATGSGDAVAGA